MRLKEIKQDLQKLKNPKKAKVLAGFFKTKKGEYGEGDRFLGVIVPNQRKVAQEYYKVLDLNDIKNLLSSKIHEYRFTALIVLLLKFKKANAKEQKEIVDFYLDNAKSINNWDLVDVSAPNILGKYFLNKDKKILYKLAKSKNLWEKRISIISTFEFIRNKNFNDTLKISEILLTDSRDLIHKAVGWMLREVGNRDLKIEEEFLQKHYKKMPRVCLRYAIEKFDQEKKIYYLAR